MGLVNRKRPRSSWRLVCLVALGVLFSRAAGQELEPEQVASKDFYGILGVSKAVSKEDIKKAYRKLAQQHHPDKATSNMKEEASRKFAELAEAYEVLNSAEKRAQYDLIREEYLASFKRNSNGGSAGAGGAWQPEHVFDFTGWIFDDPTETFRRAYSDFAGFDDNYEEITLPGARGSNPYGFPNSGPGSPFGGRSSGGGGGGSNSVGPDDDAYTGQLFEEIQDFMTDGRIYRQYVVSRQRADGSYVTEVQLFQQGPDGAFYELGPPQNMGVPPPGYPGFFGGTKGGGGRQRASMDNVLRVHERLFPGEELFSPGGRYFAALDDACNYRVYRGKGRRDAKREMVWETATYSPAGRCFAVLQGNGNLMVATIGLEPDTIEHVLFNSNKKFKSFTDESSEDYYATISPIDGNFVISKGDGPQDSNSACVWATFGCPDDGPVPWKRAFRMLTRVTQRLYCSLVGCDDEEEDADMGIDAAAAGFGENEEEESGFKKFGEALTAGLRKLKSLLLGANKQRRQA